MPWTARDAYRHTHKANTPGLQARWAKIANAALERGADEASAVRQANAVIGSSNDRPRPKTDRTNKRPQRESPAARAPSRSRPVKD